MQILGLISLWSITAFLTLSVADLRESFYLAARKVQEYLAPIFSLFLVLFTMFILVTTLVTLPFSESLGLSQLGLDSVLTSKPQLFLFFFLTFLLLTPLHTLGVIGALFFLGYKLTVLDPSFGVDLFSLYLPVLTFLLINPHIPNNSKTGELPQQVGEWLGLLTAILCFGLTIASFLDIKTLQIFLTQTYQLSLSKSLIIGFLGLKGIGWLFVIMKISKRFTLFFLAAPTFLVGNFFLGPYFGLCLATAVLSFAFQFRRV